MYAFLGVNPEIALYTAAQHASLNYGHFVGEKERYTGFYADRNTSMKQKHGEWRYADYRREYYAAIQQIHEDWYAARSTDKVLGSRRVDWYCMYKLRDTLLEKQ